MEYEKRVIKASFLTGITDIIIGFVMMMTGWHQWYFDHFHFFGIMGIAMITYSYFHYSLYLTRKR